MSKMSKRGRKVYNLGKRVGYLDGYAKGLHDGNPFIAIGEAVREVMENMSNILNNPEVKEQLRLEMEKRELAKEAEQDAETTFKHLDDGKEIMSLDEAIKHCKEKAKKLSDKAYEEWGKSMTEEEAYDCNECAREHEQLAKWLKELKDYQEGKRTCENCKHEHKTETEYPCSICRYNHPNKFEWRNGAECVSVDELDGMPMISKKHKGGDKNG